MSTTSSMDRRFLWRWISANALAECVGLGSVGLLAWLLFARAGDGAWAAPVRALAMVALGAIEGWVVGAAQAHVLKERYPRLQGWVAATVAGAIAAWALGMLPSTLIRLHGPGAGAQAPQMGEGLRLLLAAGLGMAAGPLLAGAAVGAVHGLALLAWMPSAAAPLKSAGAGTRPGRTPPRRHPAP